MSLNIRKASGEMEPFAPEKVERSLKKIHAPDEVIHRILQALKQAPEIESTKDIYHFVANYLKAIDRTLANRYNLKYALYQLGPEGFYFERFIAELFRAQEYETKNDQIVKGVCVEHEIDVVAFKDEFRYLIECKFHNRPGLKTDVKVALYIKARYEDVRETPIAFSDKVGTFNRAWLATNTKFTTDAIDYARCKDMGLVGWAYPGDTSIETMVDYYGLYPITSLLSLTYHQKQQLLGMGILLCKKLADNPQSLIILGLSPEHARQVQEECRLLTKVSS